jgi:drug/metabolite transporter (DMT)-like permease
MALVVFYWALAEGTMSIVAPLSACGAILPVIVSFIRGLSPSALATTGMAVAIAGVVLVSRSSAQVGSPIGGRKTDGRRSDRRVVGMALVSAVGFGIFFVLANEGFSTPGASPLWVLAGAKAGGLAVLGVAAAGSGRRTPWPGRRAWIVTGGGAMDTIATIFLGYAFTSGNLAVVSVLAAQYPVVTVVLARLVLTERISRAQAAGVALAFVGLAMLAAG